MGSKTVVGSLNKSDNVKGATKKKTDSEESTQNSGLEMEDSSEDKDSRIISDVDDQTDDESASEEEGDDNIEEDDGEENMIDEEEDLSDEEGMSVEDEEDMSDDDASDDDIQGKGLSDRVEDRGDGVDFTDSEDNDSEEEHEEKVNDGESSDVKVAANPAWAQAMAKILRTQTPAGRKTVVLSKARTIPAAEAAAARKTDAADEPDFEIIGESEVKPKVKHEDVKPTAEELISAKRQRLAHHRIKQEDFDYNRERALTKIATKGVVQLFNAVRAEQKNLGSKLATAHSTRMEEKLLKSIDKDSFLEHLTGKIRSQRVEDHKKKVKDEKDKAIALPKSWDELSKSVGSGNDLQGWDRVIEIKEEDED